ncbi:MAG TPA: transglycosylase domain-containing protein, partial [Steroidobacteraceae bacterium]|nr:transglycosylase domain-containing protein [Steroidobacteraceae bacterium]
MHFTTTGFIRRAFAAAGCLALLVALCFAGAFQYLEPEIPDAAALQDVRTQLPLSIYTRDSKLIAQIGEQRRVPLAYEQIPPVLIDAFLAAEDDRFFEHPGVDWEGLIRAAASNLVEGGVHQGGGTITMQLARNTVLTSERTLRRKLKEVFAALRIERLFTKREILTLYLNRIFLGQRAYGVGAAAEVYFDKKVSELTLPEAALIAGLPRSPSRDNPVASVERAKHRRAYVLRRMFETGKINAAARDAAAATPIPSQLHGPNVEVEAPYVAEMVRADLVQRLGPAALTDGYRVTTTLDSRLQGAGNLAAWRAILEYDRRHGYRGPLERLGAGVLADRPASDAALARHPAPANLVTALVRTVADRSVELALRNGAAVRLDWDALAWARPTLHPEGLGPSPKAAGEVLHPGDVVFLEPVDAARYRLAQVPAVSGSLVALDPRDGAIVSLVGGFDFGLSKFNRAVQA